MSFGSGMDAEEPRVAVVVASIDARATIEASLAGFTDELAGLGELIVVDASRDRTAEVVRAKFPHARLLRRLPGAVAPELWREGLIAADAPLVAFTTAAMVPSRGWLASLLEMLDATGAAAVGGPINPRLRLPAIDRAVYLLRYVNYLSPLPDSPPIGPPGENSLYRRERLAGLEGLVAQGFWEAEIQRALRDRGETLAMAPGAALTFHGGGRLVPTLRQRYIHARHYGAARGGRFSRAERLVRSLAAPLVPPVLIRRMFRTLRARDRSAGPWIPALPELLTLLLAWSAGEARGYWHRSLSANWLRAGIAAERAFEEEDATWEEWIWEVGRSDSSWSGPDSSAPSAPRRSTRPTGRASSA